MVAIEEQVEQLLGSAKFREFAVTICQRLGLQVPAGADPSAVYLVQLLKDGPHVFGKFVNQAYGIHLAQVAASAPKPTKEQAALMAKFDRALPAAKVLAAWKALPATSKLRTRENIEHMESWARPAFARAGGWQPLPGLSAGETALAYLHAIGSTKELQYGDVYKELAAATGNAFGDENELRQSVRLLGGARQAEQTQREVAETSTAIGEKQHKHDDQMRKQRAIKVDNPAVNPKFVEQAAVTRKYSDEGKKTTRDTVAELYKDAQGDAPPRVLVRDRKQLMGQIAYRKAARQSMAGIDMAPALRREVVAEARAQGFRVEQDLSEAT